MSALVRLDQEQAVLSAAMMGERPWRIVTERLRATDFTDLRHRTLFAALKKVPPTGERFDVLGLVGVLTESGTLADAGGKDYIGWIIDVAPTDLLAQEHANAIIDASNRRQLVATLTDVRAAIESGEPLADTERELEHRLTAIRANVPATRVFDDKRSMADAALSFVNGDTEPGTAFGFSAWDSMALPPTPGHLVLLGGASGSGKSTVARNLLRGWVMRQKRRVGWLTLEMTGEEQLVHLACIEANIAIEDYYRKRLRPHERQAFEECLAWWRDTDSLRINEQGAVTPDAALRIFRRWREEGVDHFVLDHLHRIDYGAKHSGDDLRVPVANFARSLKSFAKDHQAIVCALVQYSKIKPEDAPSDDKIRESNNVLEESDAVFHIYRPLVACERDTSGALHPLTQPDGSRYYESDQPTGSILAHDPATVYIKLGKQRRRIRNGTIAIPFDARRAMLYSTPRADNTEAA